MRLVRFGTPGREKPGVLLDEATILDVSDDVADFDGRFLAEGGLAHLRRLLERPGATSRRPRVAPSNVRLGPPVARPTQLLAAGVNYPMHSRETGVKPPERPVLFAKAVTAVTGPYDPIRLPSTSARVDWEVELAFVVGARVRDLAVEDAARSIAGYLVMNDVSEREVQKHGGLRQWYRGKSFDTFAPLGPWLVTADEIEDPHDLVLELAVNGEIRQRSRTGEMIFRCEELLAHASSGHTLLPGDVIATGTPDGVGFTRDPPCFLAPGDVVEAAVEGLGSQRNPVVAPANVTSQRSAR